MKLVINIHIYIYIYIIAVKQLVTSKINVFVYVIYVCVYCVYLLCIYGYTHIQYSIYFGNIYMYIQVHLNELECRGKVQLFQ